MVRRVLAGVRLAWAWVGKGTSDTMTTNRATTTGGVRIYPVAAPVLAWPGSATAAHAIPGDALARGRPSSRRAQLPPAAARRLRTGCVGEELYDDTYTLLVTREWPLHLAEDGVREWWPALAPSLTLVRMRRGASNASMPWAEFAGRYRAELDALPVHAQQTYTVWLGHLLATHPSVTLLSCEPNRGRPEATVHAQRRVLHDWLVN